MGFLKESPVRGYTSSHRSELAPPECEQTWDHGELLKDTRRPRKSAMQSEKQALEA